MEIGFSNSWHKLSDGTKMISFIEISYIENNEYIDFTLAFLGFVIIISRSKK